MNFFLLFFVISAIVAGGLYYVSADFLSGKYPLSQLTFFTLFLSSGMFILFLIFDNYSKLLKEFAVYVKKKNILKFLVKKKNTDRIFLAIWFIGVFIFNFTFAGGSARYETLLLPPFVFFFLNISRNYVSLNKIKYFLTITIIFTLILSFLVTFSIFQYASSYKKFSDTFVFPNNKKVYIMGHEGFKYYMEKKGAIFFQEFEGRINEGDIIIRATLPSPGKIDNEYISKIDYLTDITLNSNYPIRVYNTDAHAAFYNYGAGFLPYSFSRSPIETFEIFRVRESIVK